jgi:hypothetical protein
MRITICIVTAAVIATAPTVVSAKTAKAATFQLNETSWTYVDPDKKVKARESIDAKGNYIENAVSGKHIDHGTAVMKDNKACFTSAMTKDGEMCWTTKPTKIGQSMMTTNDKGRKLTVKRIAYAPMSMPK